MEATNTTIVAKNPILVAKAGEPKRNMSLAEARSKLFSSVISSALNKSHDHAKPVPINVSINANKGPNSMPLTSPSYVIEKNEMIRLQIVNRQQQQQLQAPQMKKPVPAITASIPPSLVPKQKEKAVPLLLPFPPGQITIKSNRPPEQTKPSTTSNIKSIDMTTQRTALAKARLGLVPIDTMPKRGRPISLGDDDSKPKLVSKVFLELPAPMLQHYNGMQSTLGYNYMPKEVSASLQEFKQWVRIRNEIRINQSRYDSLTATRSFFVYNFRSILNLFVLVFLFMSFVSIDSNSKTIRTIQCPNCC